jgi:MOSC domain
MTRRLNIDGDRQGDLDGHGGDQRAVLVYQIASYRCWQRHFGRDDFSYGQFGENLAVDGLPDDQVCIGDRYRIGGVFPGSKDLFHRGFFLLAAAPAMPSSPISRSTVHRATSVPSRFSCRHTFRAP